MTTTSEWPQIVARGLEANVSSRRSTITEDVRLKSQAGFPISLVDIWGRALAMHVSRRHPLPRPLALTPLPTQFFNGTTESDFFDTNDPHDQGLLWSSIRYTQNFQSHAMPFPLVVSTSRVSAEEQVTGNSSTVIPLRNTVSRPSFLWTCQSPLERLTDPLTLTGLRIYAIHVRLFRPHPSGSHSFDLPGE